jgi:hypothetical protein
VHARVQCTQTGLLQLKVLEAWEDPQEWVALINGAPPHAHAHLPRRQRRRRRCHEHLGWASSAHRAPAARTRVLIDVARA